MSGLSILEDTFLDPRPNPSGRHSSWDQIYAIPSATDVETMVAAVEPLSGETVTLLRSVLTLFTVAGRR